MIEESSTQNALPDVHGHAELIKLIWSRGLSTKLKFRRGGLELNNVHGEVRYEGH